MPKPNTDSITERRLRPVYEWLDNGNFKKAIQEADRLLKKQPDLLCAKALKALALIRQQKHSEGETILDEVIKEHPVEDGTLQAIIICYKELHKVEKICEVYENALTRQPYSEEINTHLFMSYVRIGDYKKQQQVALNLFKITPKNPYYFWGVMSIMMQAQTIDKTIAQKVTLPLAERMIKKFIDEGKIEAEQEVQLYLLVLERQEKYKEALDVINSELGEKVTYNFSRKRIHYLKALQRWRQLNAQIKKMLFDEPDAYAYYEIYIDTVFKLVDEKRLGKTSECGDTVMHNDKPVIADDTIDSCFVFITSMRVKDPSQKHKLRGPHLASFLLYKRMLDEKLDPTDLFGDPIHLFQTYFDLFGDKPSYFKDLYAFFPLVRLQCVKLLSATWVLITEMEEEHNQSKSKLLKYTTHLQLSRYYGIHHMFSENDMKAQTAKLLEFYHEGHRFSENLHAADLKNNDTLMVLVVHSLLDLYGESNNLQYIKDAICLLEYAYPFSSSNYDFKLLLLKLYNMFGASKAAYTYYELLDIKYMQHDSLGYLHCWALLYTGQYTLARQVIHESLKFFNSNTKEVTDQLTYAYKYGSFEKAYEFLNFRDTLKKSFHYCIFTLEDALHDAIIAPGHEDAVDVAKRFVAFPSEGNSVDIDDMVDNRDFSVYLTFEPPSKMMNERYQKMSFEQEKLLIRLRRLLLRNIVALLDEDLYASTISTVKSTTSNGLDHSNAKLEAFQSAIEELKDLHKSFLQNPPEDIPKSVNRLNESSKLFLYTRSPYYMSQVIDAFTLAHVFTTNVQSESANDKELMTVAEMSSVSFTKLMASCIDKITYMLTNYNEIDQKEVFEFFAVAVEISCITCLVCGVLYNVLTKCGRTGVATVKRKKKKDIMDLKDLTITKTNSLKSELRENVVKVYQYYWTVVHDNMKAFEIHLIYLTSCWSDLETHEPEFSIRRKVAPENRTDSDDFNPFVGISDAKWDELQSLVNCNLSDSYRSSAHELQELIAKKIYYLDLIKL